jgi:hypothetical protein
MLEKHTIRNGKLDRVQQIFGGGKVIPAERTAQDVLSLIKELPEERCRVEMVFDASGKS